MSHDCLSQPIPPNVDHWRKTVRRWGNPVAEGEVALVARFGARGSGVRPWAITSLSGVIVYVSGPVFSGELKAGGGR